MCVTKDDTSLWRRGSGFKQQFSTLETWNLLRETKPSCNWACGIWFSHSTPKYAFISWLAVLNRLSTLDRIFRWSQGVNTTCVLCKSDVESRKHLFFECSYSSEVWEHLVKGILLGSYTNKWDDILVIISNTKMERKRLFCLRYAFQIALYSLWRERNKLLHGEKLIPIDGLKKMVDKGVRNKLSLLKKKCRRGMEGCLQFWFATRI